MTVGIQSAYTLPNGKNAHIVHEGLVPRVLTVDPSSEVAGYSASFATSGDTVDRWRPFSNVVASPTNFSTTSWNKFGSTVAADGITFAETSTTGGHGFSQTFTWGFSSEYVVGFRISRNIIPRVTLSAYDGTTYRIARFDLRTLTVYGESGATGYITELSRDELLISMKVTVAAGTGNFGLTFLDATGATTYTGYVNRKLVVREAYCHLSSATLRYDQFDAKSCNVFAIAGHNLNTGGTVSFEHDSNYDGTFTSLGTVTPTNKSPIMFLHSGVTSERWRIRIYGFTMPQISVFKVGTALAMERPFYGGFAPTPMNRQTEVLGNLSGTGQLLGRSKKRSILNASYAWTYLTHAWVRANLDGDRGLIRAAETEPLFVAWRPTLQQDVDYVMRAKTTAPENSGTKDFMNFSLSGESHSYD